MSGRGLLFVFFLLRDEVLDKTKASTRGGVLLPLRRRIFFMIWDGSADITFGGINVKL